MRRVLASLALLAACDGGADGRAAWLQTTLVLDNQVFLDTDPAQAEAKFARMSLGLFAYFRGTLGQYVRDVVEAGGAGYVHSDFASAETADIALVGDPHPENIGSFRDADGQLVADFNDFDAATYGPFHYDVRRLALGFHLAGVELGVAAPERAAEAAAAAYVAEIAALESGEPGYVLTAGTSHGKIVDHMFKKADEDGRAREELGDYTRIVDDRREMFFGEVEAPVAWRMASDDAPMMLATDEVVPVTQTESQLVDQLLAAWPSSLHDPAAMTPAAAIIKGVSRRYGAGVASYAAPRYYVLIEGPTTAPDDDLLLEIKQVYDPAPLAGVVRLPSQPFADNGARVVDQQRTLQTNAACDPLLGHASVGAATFRIRDRSKYQRGVDLAKIAEKMSEGDWHDADLEVLAGHAGHLLARAHASAPRQAGPVGLPAIAAVLARGPDEFVAETLAFVDEYAPVVEADFQRFQDTLAAAGPSLGYTWRQ